MAADPRKTTTFRFAWLLTNPLGLAVVASLGTIAIAFAALIVIGRR